jgi:hypothetical protein
VSVEDEGEENRVLCDSVINMEYNLNITPWLVACIMLRVLGQVQGFRLTQHWF